jgi:hypothetical protein
MNGQDGNWLVVLPKICSSICLGLHGCFRTFAKLSRSDLVSIQDSANDQIENVTLFG